jgi:hypothetical protein
MPDDESRARTVRREVRSEDPSLSPEANRLLTEELRDLVGSDHVEVPEGTPDRRGATHAERSRWGATLRANRLPLLVSLAALLTVGVIVSLVTGSWWALVAAAGIHAVGTLVVATGAIQLTTEVEHVDPTTAARLEEEGVSDPDRVVSELASDFAGERHARGAAEVVSTGFNENATSDEHPERVVPEQRTALTPDARGSAPAGTRSPIAAMPAAIVAGLVVLTLAVAIAEGGVLWLVAAITWAGATVWLALTLRVDGPAEERAARAGRPRAPGGRAAGDAHAGARAVGLPVIAVVTVGVIGFCILMGVVVGEL